MSTTAPLVKGWCPGALRPMLSGDGYVVRIRPHAGRLSQAQASGIAGLAKRYGNGLIDLSARANLQLRGVTEAGHTGLIEGLRTFGLIDISPEAEARRNILVTPFHEAGDGTMELAAALEAALFAGPDLPGKFGFALDTGHAPVLRGASADIRVERTPDGLICRADGAITGASVTAQSAVAAALDLAHWFVAAGGMVNRRGRMAALVASGAGLPDRFRAVPVPCDSAAVPDPGPLPPGQLVGLPFGQMTAETLAAIAALGPIRLTPWRMLLVETPKPIQIPGTISTSGDPLLHVSACTGAPGCPQGLQATRPLARGLAHLLPSGTDLHISGCAKGCAHPAAAAITLTATPNGFDLVHAGRAWDRPVLTDLPPDPAAIADILNRVP